MPPANPPPSDDNDESPPLYVQYVHGLDSGINGRKVQMLKKKRKGLRPMVVVAPDMQGLIRSARLRGSLCVLAMACQGCMHVYYLLGTELSVFAGSKKSMAVLLLGVAIFLAASFLATVYTTRNLLQNCVDLHLQAMRLQKPDLLIGSSFGGAVVARLVTLGHYRGPILLLAPAQFRLDWLTWLGQKASASFPSPVLVVHGSKDTIVPVADSERLVAMHSQTTQVELLIVNDNHPLLYTYKKHHREWIQRAIEIYESAEKKKD